MDDDGPAATRACLRFLRCRLALAAAIAAILLSALSFAAGYEASSRRHEDRVFQEGKRQMLEALVNCIRSGIIEVNEDRLSDLTDK